MQVMMQTRKVIHLGFETLGRHHQKSKTGVLWSIQTELKWDRDRVRMGHCILCRTFTLPLMWDRDLYLYFGIVSVLVPVPFPHMFCLHKSLVAPQKGTDVLQKSFKIRACIA